MIPNTHEKCESTDSLYNPYESLHNPFERGSRCHHAACNFAAGRLGAWNPEGQPRTFWELFLDIPFHGYIGRQGFIGTCSVMVDGRGGFGLGFGAFRA